jgi:hypothetical protein
MTIPAAGCSRGRRTPVPEQIGGIRSRSVQIQLVTSAQIEVSALCWRLRTTLETGWTDV